MIDLAEHLIAHARVPGFEISEEVWEQGWVLHAHVHERPHFVVIFEGECREHEVSGSRVMDRSSVMYFPAGLCHAVEFKRKTTLLSIEIDEERGPMAGALFGDATPATVVASGEIFPLALRIRDELHNRRSSTDVALEGLALELMATASRLLGSRPGPRAPEWAGEARKIIDERYMDKLRLTDLARALGVSAISLADGFRRAFDCSVGDYLRRKRVERAIEMLVGSSLSLGEIAIGTGFCDQSHFVRVFKAQTGMTPSRYRRNHTPSVS
ncbi:MAG: helix-turn-helix transcriptional regulator [Acidobacteria bacterium]|nr:helix-turn-helix transcriptional regulator [Acidobacteriota bacterium]